ncbi:hypothetical protein [Streptomyces sp. NPDC051218]|uniref:hypothetical protein n=1 Tax=Streptomyces sp. NPDC051218 TaxID=3365645 RepID=UPI0037A1358E
MAFGKGGARDEAPVPAVEWVGVREFTVGMTELPVTKGRGSAVRGPRAIRVPQGKGSSLVFAPCAYVGPVAPPAPSSALDPCLYEDLEKQRLLCCLVAEGDEGGERCFRVLDGQGTEIGTIRRVPPSRKPFKHTWRIDQPGHTEIVGRNRWASGDAKRIAARGAETVFHEALDSLFYSEETASPPRPKSRTLEWLSDSELVMVSQGTDLFTVRVDWLDRRLAFAFALLGDR